MKPKYWLLTVIGLCICLGGIWLIVYDALVMLEVIDGRTLSEILGGAAQIVVFAAGFGVGLVSGAVLGHLYWAREKHLRDIAHGRIAVKLLIVMQGGYPSWKAVPESTVDMWITRAEEAAK